MNFTQALELHRTIDSFCYKILQEHPKIGIYDIQSRDQGFLVCVKTQRFNQTIRAFLERTALTHRLELRRFKGYYVLNSIGGINLIEN